MPNRRCLTPSSKVAKVSRFLSLGLLCAAGFLMSLTAARADTTADPTVLTPPPDHTTKIIVIVKHNPGDTPHSEASQTVIAAPEIEHSDPSLTINQFLARTISGASINPDYGLRIRGADDQFSTFLDGVPIPQSISGTITDALDPKDIQSMHVYTGGFPAEYGNLLAGVFDVTTKSGIGKPSGTVVQSAADQSTYVTFGTVGGGDQRLGYFVTGSRRQTGFFLNPPIQDVTHDAGHEDHGFLKFNYTAGSKDGLILQLGDTGSNIDIPDTPDTQQENGQLANFVWQHTGKMLSNHLAIYTRTSTLIFTGSPADISSEGLLDTNENLRSATEGVRDDLSFSGVRAHRFQVGFDISNTSADEGLVINLPPPPDGPGGSLGDDSTNKASNVGIYAQDDWSPGHFLVNYGVRFDQNSEDVTKNQVSPRINIRYKLTSQDTLHAFYDRLFQPIPAQDAKHLVGNSEVGDTSTYSPLLPERDSLYEVGIDHDTAGFSIGAAAYYKTGVDVRDDDSVGNTQITLPVNDAKAYFRGIEFTINRVFSSSLQGFGNLALSWNKNAGPVTGGLNQGGYPSAYFYDDHDQTYTSTFGLSYDRSLDFADLICEYGSGQPYGEIDDENGDATDLNYVRVPPHFIINIDGGKRTKHGSEASIFANNLLNHGYVIKQVTDLSTAQWAQGRVIGIKLSQDF